MSSVLSPIGDLPNNNDNNNNNFIKSYESTYNYQITEPSSSSSSSSLSPIVTDKLINEEHSKENGKQTCQELDKQPQQQNNQLKEIEENIQENLIKEKEKEKEKEKYNDDDNNEDWSSPPNGRIEGNLKRFSFGAEKFATLLDDVLTSISGSNKSKEEDELFQKYSDRSAASFPKACKSGYLTKQGWIHKTWRERYFILDNYVLLYYETPKSEHPKGVIDLAGCEVLRDVTRGKKNCFQISHKKKSNKRRTFVFYAKSQEDMKAWIRCLAEVIACIPPKPKKKKDKVVVMRNKKSNDNDNDNDKEEEENEENEDDKDKNHQLSNQAIKQRSKSFTSQRITTTYKSNINNKKENDIINNNNNNEEEDDDDDEEEDDDDDDEKGYYYDVDDDEDKAIEKRKQTIIQMYKNNSSNNNNKEKENNKNNEIKQKDIGEDTFTKIVENLQHALLAQVEPHGSQTGHWKVLKEQDKILVSKRVVRDSSWIMTRVEGRIKASAATIVKHIASQKYDDMVISTKVLEKPQAHTDIAHVKVKLRHPLTSNRDFVLLRFKCWDQIESRWILGATSVDSSPSSSSSNTTTTTDCCPSDYNSTTCQYILNVPEEDGFVRGRVMNSGWVIEPLGAVDGNDEDEVYCTYILCIDFQGWLPSWVIRLIRTEDMLASFISLKQICEIKE